ncbi:MAG: hypothetical protein ACI9K4_000658, partial [Polaribacter sp.]
MNLKKKFVKRDMVNPTIIKSAMLVSTKKNT